MVIEISGMSRTMGREEGKWEGGEEEGSVGCLLGLGWGSVNTTIEMP